MVESVVVGAAGTDWGIKVCGAEVVEPVTSVVVTVIEQEIPPARPATGINQLVALDGGVVVTFIFELPGQIASAVKLIRAPAVLVPETLTVAAVGRVPVGEVETIENVAAAGAASAANCKRGVAVKSDKAKNIFNRNFVIMASPQYRQEHQVP